MHLARVEQLEIAHIGLKGSLGAPLDELAVVAISVRVPKTQGVGGPLDIDDGCGTAVAKGRHVQIGNGLLSDATQDLILGQRIVRAPVAVDRYSGLILRIMPEKYVCPGTRSQHTHPTRVQLCYGTETLGPHILVNHFRDIFVECPQFCTLVETASFFWQFYYEPTPHKKNVETNSPSPARFMKSSADCA